ncbi:uncharacterized protein LOC129763517 isoform X2 [Toxorhynchites rutilus septentrionalis]|uniref:uncharacterized protein LOC129763517 isoform X2 n=1 Tax=Toxorhynchites rutilus septentrionalis TaxID=329112 RepID=UPI002478E6E3|nr:uncharacterized protein LOC129763517 isoform X2 [Toxorhynchites rutilus septentrionalis]
MSIEPTNATKAAAARITTTNMTILPSAGMDDEEESTLVEISPSSSSSPPTMSSLSLSSRTSSTGTGDDVESHPDVVENIVRESTTTSNQSNIIVPPTGSSQISTVTLTEALTPEQFHQTLQQNQQPTHIETADHSLGLLPRNPIPIQSSSPVSTPSSAEECDDSATISTTEGALIVSSSNNQLNNNNNTAISHSELVATQDSSIKSVLPPSPAAMSTVVSNTTSENAPSVKEGVTTMEAPLEIVQIFPRAETALSSSSSSASSSSTSSSASSTSTSSASSTSSSPSVSPLAVFQQPHPTKDTPSTKVQEEVVVPKIDDHSSSELGDGLETEEISEESTTWCKQDESQNQHLLTSQNQCLSSAPPQHLQSSLKKEKIGEQLGGENRRRVSFPHDTQLITGYLEPIDPWACVETVSVPEILNLYRKSCSKHSTEPLSVITEHLQTLDLTIGQRVPLLSLHNQNLSHGSCEALEEIFKRIQYRCINLSHAGLDDTSASVLFDMIEYYEATNELDISDNLSMTNKSWLACINMVKKCQALHVLVTRGPAISEHHAMNLAKALNTSALHTLKLESCELSQRPLSTLCNLLKRNTVLRELSLAHNQLTCEDAKNIANLLRSNYHIQLLDISNNNIGDKGVEFIVTALIEQSIYFKTMQETRRKTSAVHRNRGMHHMHYFSQKQQLQQKQQTPPKAPQLPLSEGLVVITPPTPPPPPPPPLPPTLVDDTPKTPPSTPALPIVRTPSDDMFIESTNTQSKIEAQFSAGSSVVHLQKTASKPEQHVQVPIEVLSTNNDSGINCSVSSIEEHMSSESTIDDVNLATSKDGKVEAEHLPTRIALLTTQPSNTATVVHDNKSEKQSPSPLVDVVTPRNESEDNQIEPSVALVEQQECRTTSANENDSGGGRGIKVPEGGGKKQKLVLACDLDREKDKGPKKARLAKQDSVLSEFESNNADLKDLSEVAAVKMNTKKENVDHVEEDTPEICEDYDDDTSLKILEEHLLVDRSINANSCQEVKNPATKEDHKGAENVKTNDSDDSAPINLLATFKKDELQLLIEKSKQLEEDKEGEPVKTAPVPVVSLQRSGDRIEEGITEDITSTSAPEKLESIPRKIIEGEIQTEPLSRSLDSTSAADFDSTFLRTEETPVFPNERSFSSESLNSETSVDSNDSKSSLKIIESKFARNGTLERQQSSGNKYKQLSDQPSVTPCGLQVLVLWNNEITRNSAQTFADLIENSSTLEILNVGCNLLCNDFVTTIKNSLKTNSSITSLGLQGAHLSDNGAKVMSEVIEFGGNSTLQRIDLRNNNILTNGLDHINEALKSNKVVTRIDLDEVPRRAMENEVGPDYARLLDNIRAQCERNKHPVETTEAISTAVKRVRAAHLNSRKISLTCTSIRTSPSTAASDKHHHHLLDPSKKPGGRLRSPLPSPIPSPIASPVPSPSRNRFQVTRVGESTGSNSSLTSINSNNNTSTSPSPSSTGSSPTLFFAANSRFRVVTVEEPASSSSFVANHSQGKVPSSCNSSSPLVAPSNISRIHPTTSSSAPALSSFVTLPKSTSSPIPHSVATNTSSPPVLVQHLHKQSPLQQQQQQPHSPSLSAVNTQTPPTPKSKHTRLPSTSSTLNDSAFSSTSMESPDLEVKRFMSGVGTLQPSTIPVLSSTMDDSCCSSVSSIDSTDNAQFNNTSISSTDESFDLIISSPTSSLMSVGSVNATPLVKVALSQQEDSIPNPTHQQQLQHQFLHQHTPQQQPTKGTPILANVKLLKVKNNSLSSLDMSTSSQESLYDVNELSSLSSCGGDSSLLTKGHKTGPPSSGNSNEGTLTSIQGLEKDKQATAGKPADKPARVRKTSWIASLGNHPKTDGTSSITTGSASGGSASSGYSPAIEKLLAIFSPSNLFSSSRSSPPNSECVIPMIGASAGGKENVSSQAPTRKESPMGGLFQWTKSSKDEEKVLKVNISPENTITPQLQQMTHFQQSPQIATYCVENIPTQLKAEIKENISPENTITNKLLVTPMQSPQHTVPAITPVSASTATTVVTPHPKVIFRLGDDYDESEDDIDTLTSKYGGGGGSSSGDFNKTPPSQLPSTLLGATTGSTTTNSSGISISSGMAEGSPIQTGILQTSHLGQLARDSLTSMFKTSSLTSQDSIRSMDSLAEMTESVPKSQQQQQHHPHQQGPGYTQPQ